MKLTDQDWKHVVGMIVLVAVVAPFVVYAVPQVIGASQAYVVLSSSMSPSIHAGDVVVVDDVQPEEVEKSDVITYHSPGDRAALVTHRVVEVIREDGQLQFRTKGDANEEPDTEPVPASNVVGIVLFHIPLIGYVIEFGQSSLGILLLVIVPAVLLILSEIYSLYTDALVDQTDGTTDTNEPDEWQWTDEPATEETD